MGGVQGCEAEAEAEAQGERGEERATEEEKRCHCVFWWVSDKVLDAQEIISRCFLIGVSRGDFVDGIRHQHDRGPGD